jgi:peptide/nickel transport system substrate-binding protein
VARGVALAAAAAAALLAVSGAGGGTEQTPKRGGTVVYGVFREPPCLNAYLRRCDSSFPYVGALSSLALRGAFRIGSGLDWEPDLVSDVDFTTKRPFTLTYHIRPAARWSDGTPVTARDFEFTYSTVRRLGDEVWEGEAEVYDVVRSVRAVGAKMVRVVLRSRDAAWRALFGRVLPAHALRGQNVVSAWTSGIHDPTTGRSIGNGPFLFERWEREREISFVRNRRYWKDRRPNLDRIVVRFVRSSGDLQVDAFERLRSGELDVVNNVVFSGDQIPELQRSGSLEVLVRPNLAWEHVDIRIGPGGHPALKRKAVRQALAFGIDRVAIARTLFGRLYPPSDSAVYRVPSSHYRPNWRSYRYSPARARQLLQQAGCSRGADGIYVCAEGRLSLRLDTIAGSAQRAQVVEMIRRQLREAGVEIVPAYTPRNPLFDQIIAPGRFDLAYYTWVQSPDSPGGSGTLFGCQGELNYSGYCQRIVTRDLDQARRILNGAHQARVLNRADRQLAKDVPVIPLFDFPIAIVTRADVRGVGVTSAQEPFADAENWWLDD